MGKSLMRFRILESLKDSAALTFLLSIIIWGTRNFSVTEEIPYLLILGFFVLYAALSFLGRTYLKNF